MSAPAAQRLAELATLPYRRGAEVLEIPVEAGADGVHPVRPYDYREYRARHGDDPPDPRYLLELTVPAGSEPVEVAVELDTGAGTVTAALTVPAGALAGESFTVPLPPGAGPDVRLLEVTARPDPGPGAFRLLALLGNVSKLLWVLGREQDLVRARMEEVRRQRSLVAARAASLDLLGADLRVPRFPPRPYSFDVATLALYHLDEHPVADGGAVADETARFGGPGHPAENRGAASGARGKFGGGFALPGRGGDGHLVIPHDPDFNAPAGRSFTVELFLRPAPGLDGVPRAVVVKGSLAADGRLAGNGWALTLGTFREVPANLRWAARSAGAAVELFTDVSLADGAFHHVAGVLDREAGLARLFVDGTERARAPLGELGAAGNGQQVRVGRSAAGHQLAGTVDELRFSREARRSFEPALGEGDEAYRQRLGIFERWLLPTPENLLRALNGAVSLGGEEEPFVLVERDRPVAVASHPLRLVPTALAAGAHLDRDGDPERTALEVCGSSADEPGFSPALLVRHDAPGVSYPGGEDARRMQAAAWRPLEELRALLAEEAVGPGNLRLHRAFDPGAGGEEGADLHRVGRALLLSHESADAGALAALAHRAGFDYVERRPTRVFAAVAPGPALEVMAVPAAGVAPPGADVTEGQALDLSVLPAALPATGRFEWSLIRCGAGDAHLGAHSDDAGGEGLPPVRNRSRVQLRADAAGEVAVSVEYRLAGVTVTGSRILRVAPADLADGEGLAGDGSRGVDLTAAVGEPEADFDPRYLVQHASGASLGPGADARMQLPLDRCLTRLVELLAPADPARLQLLRAFDPAAGELHAVGRAALLRHLDVPPGALASLAHQAGFGWAERQGNRVLCAAAAGEKVEVVLAGGGPLPRELPVGAPVDLELRPAGLEADGDLNWSLEEVGHGRGTLFPVLLPASTLTPQRPGLLALNAYFLETAAGATAPYSFEVRLRPELDVPETLIPKERYDLVMNILSHFHPLGVEVLTRNLREHVVEVRDDLLNAFPGYTYPEFRP